MSDITFSKLKLIEPVLKALTDSGYEIPTQIQAEAIPIALNGNDLLAVAPTGTGKTAAFSIPIIQGLEEASLNPKFRDVKALILTPTRELAIQIEENFKVYAKYTKLRCMAIFGGVSQKPQEDNLRRGIDVLIATPGRLIDLLNQRRLTLDYIDTLVLDEADRMLDMGFINDVKRIVKVCPTKRQTLFFSATMPPEIVRLTETILTKPVRIEVAPKTNRAELIAQQVYFVTKEDKRSLLRHLLADKTITCAIIFTRTKHGADKLSRDLKNIGIKSDALHGNKSQNARQNALAGFKNGTIKVLVATDIAARGIDVDDVSHVFNYEIPNEPETYVHRIGRTGRAGASGIAIALCDEEEVGYLKDIQFLIGHEIKVIKEHPFVPTHNISTVFKKAKGPKPGAKPDFRHGNKPKPNEANHSGRRDIEGHATRKPKQAKISSERNTPSPSSFSPRKENAFGAKPSETGARKQIIIKR